MTLNTHTANVFLPGCLGPVRREVVLVEDAEAELAALREELAKQRNVKLILAERVQNAEDNCSVYRVLLAATEQRNAALIEAMERIHFRCESFSNEALGMQKNSVRVMLDIATKALKPTESGASE